MALTALTSWLPGSAQAATPDLTCKMHFNLHGWSAIYKTSSGTGTVKCSDGETAKVKLSQKGGGLTAGKSSIENGVGTFSGVKSLNDVFGSYASANAEAGAVKGAGAQALTKGEVNLALSGTGSGINLGVSGSSFSIEPYSGTK
ncbi:MAG: hypothetical protein JST54_15525 [Deltaproteobacteria bacterium]|nr:hypothetical protein [Deltaproteobacteria bacterium]